MIRKLCVVIGGLCTTAFCAKPYELTTPTMHAITGTTASLKLGAVLQDAPYRIPLVVDNNGTEAVTLHHINASCGCLVAKDWEPATVQPKTSCVVPLILDTGPRIGDFSIMVQGADASDNAAFEALLKFKAVARAEFAEDFVTCSAGSNDATVTLSLRCGPLRIKDLQLSTDEAHASAVTFPGYPTTLEKDESTSVAVCLTNLGSEKDFIPVRVSQKDKIIASTNIVINAGNQVAEGTSK